MIKKRASKNQSKKTRSLRIETLESRNLMTATPDFVANRVEIPDTTLLAGYGYRFEYFVSNTGSRVTTPLSLQLDFVHQSSGTSYTVWRGTEATTFITSSRGPQRFASTYLLPSNLPTGNYNAVLRVDSNNTFRESNENNNTARDQVFVRGSSVMPLPVTPAPPTAPIRPTTPVSPPSTQQPNIPIGTRAGDLDRSFGSQGKVALSLPINDNGGSSNLVATVVQPDGKIVGIGSTGVGVDSDILVVRFNTNGSLDRTFGENGTKLVLPQTLISNAARGFYEEGLAVALQGDGKIVVAGVSGNDFYIARLNTDGSLDNSFGADGRTRVSFDRGGNNSDIARALRIQRDGKIVVGGTVSTSNGGKDFGVIRLTTNGALDRGFGVEGRQTVAFNLGGNLDDILTDIALDTNGRIVLGGHAAVSGVGDRDFAAARLNSNGTLDRSFGRNGLSRISFNKGGVNDDGANSIAIQNDGKIVLAGYAQFSSSGDYDFAAVRLLSNGQIDPKFGTNGRVTVAFDLGGSKNDKVRSLRIDNRGRILLGGFSQTGSKSYDMAIVRLNTNGTIDTTFGRSGKQTVAFDRGGDNDDAILGLNLFGDKIILAGESQRNATVYDAAIATLWNI